MVEGDDLTVPATMADIKAIEKSIGSALEARFLELQNLDKLKMLKHLMEVSLHLLIHLSRKIILMMILMSFMRSLMML